jgi:hypothetical protein
MIREKNNYYLTSSKQISANFEEGDMVNYHSRQNIIILDEVQGDNFYLRAVFFFIILIV